MSVAPALSWHLGVALVVLAGLAVGASWLGRARLELDVSVAALRAVVQLAVAAAVVAAVLDRAWAAALFAVFMFAVAVVTAGGRIEARRCVGWIAVAIVGGVVPVLALVFGTGAVGLTGPAIVAIAGIVIGGSTTAHTLTARRAFDAIRTGRGQVEAQPPARGEKSGQQVRSPLTAVGPTGGRSSAGS